MYQIRPHITRTIASNNIIDWKKYIHRGHVSFHQFENNIVLIAKKYDVWYLIMFAFYFQWYVRPSIVKRFRWCFILIYLLSEWTQKLLLCEPLCEAYQY